MRGRGRLRGFGEYDGGDRAADLGGGKAVMAFGDTLGFSVDYCYGPAGLFACCWLFWGFFPFCMYYLFFSRKTSRHALVLYKES